MAKITNEILVVDLEATCWNEPAPPGMKSEIIEIGLCVLSRNNGDNVWRVGKSESIIVRPRTSKVSTFCTELTTLTQKDVDKGLDLFDACRHLEATFDSTRKPWASWGEWDESFMKTACHSIVRYPMSETHLNMKPLFSILFKHPKELGLHKATEVAGLEWVGTHHRGVDDAINAARILERILP